MFDDMDPDDGMDDMDLSAANNDEYLARLEAHEARLLHLPTRFLSYSQLTLYASCPRRYYYRYVLGQRAGTSSAMALGTLTHGAIEQGVNFKIQHQREPELAQLLDWIEDESKILAPEIKKWDDDQYLDIVDPEARRQMLANEARALASVFVRERLPKLLPRVSEYKVETLLRGRIPYIGYIDLITKDPDAAAMNPEYANSGAEAIHPLDTIRDVKTVKKNYRPDQIANSLQLSLYAYATGAHTVAYELIRRPGKTARTAAPVTIPWPAEGAAAVVRSRAELEHALDHVEDVAQAMAQGSYPRIGPESWVCNAKWCDYYDQCRGSRANETARIA